MGTRETRERTQIGFVSARPRLVVLWCFGGLIFKIVPARRLERRKLRRFEWGQGGFRVEVNAEPRMLRGARNPLCAGKTVTAIGVVFQHEASAGDLGQQLAAAYGVTECVAFYDGGFGEQAQ